MIKLCQEIPHCDPINGLTIFNRCTQCDSGYSLNEEKNNCVKTDFLENCHLFKVRKGVTDFDNVTCKEDQCECLICQKGYVPDDNLQLCVKVELEKCLQTDYMTRVIADQVNEDFNLNEEVTPQEEYYDEDVLDSH